MDTEQSFRHHRVGFVKSSILFTFCLVGKGHIDCWSPRPGQNYQVLRTRPTIFTEVIFKSGKQWRHMGKKVNIAALEDKIIFPNNFWTNRARAEITVPSRSSHSYASKYVNDDHTRSQQWDIRSRDLNVTSRSTCISLDASWWAEHNETMRAVVALFYAKLLVKNNLVTLDDVTWTYGCHIVQFAST